jgi:hypothetical protein
LVEELDEEIPILEDDSSNKKKTSNKDEEDHLESVANNIS